MAHLERADDGSAVLTLSGAVDIAATEHPAALVTALDPSEVTSLTIDLTAVSFMDSSGLALLEVLHRWAGEAVEIRLRGASAGVRTLLDITSMDDWFVVEPEA